MLPGLWLALSVLTGALAARKGYSVVLWTLAGGVLGLVVLAFLPRANNSAQTSDERERLQGRGNIAAAALLGLSAMVVVGALLINALWIVTGHG